MKNTFITFFVVLFFLNSSVGWSLDYKDLVQRDGLFYEKFTDVPFTGEITGEEKGSFKNGKKEGFFFKYYKNGQLWSKGNFKNNKKEGSWIVYFNNGQIFSKGKYKNGRPEGYWVMYEKDGTIVTETEAVQDTPSYISKKNQCLISISPKDHSFVVENHLMEIFGALHELRIKTNVMQNSAISFSMCADFDQEKLDELKKKLATQFEIRYNDNCELITVRHFKESTIEELTKGKDVLLEQRTRTSAQLVVKQLMNHRKLFLNLLGQNVSHFSIAFHGPTGNMRRENHLV